MKIGYWVMILTVFSVVFLVGCNNYSEELSDTAVSEKTVLSEVAETQEEAEILGGLDDVKQLDNFSTDLEEDVNFEDLEKLTVE